MATRLRVDLDDDGTVHVAPEPGPDIDEAAQKALREAVVGFEQRMRWMSQLISDQTEEARARTSQQMRKDLFRQLVSQDVDLVEPASLQQARRQAAVRLRLLSTPVFTYETLSEVRADPSVNATRTAISRARTEGRVFTVNHDGRSLLPAFQFDSEGQIRPDLEDLIVPLANAGMGPWQMWSWLTSPTGLLSGLIPVEAVGDRTTAERAARAAQRMADRLREGQLEGQFEGPVIQAEVGNEPQGEVQREQLRDPQAQSRHPSVFKSMRSGWLTGDLRPDSGWAVRHEQEDRVRGGETTRPDSAEGDRPRVDPNTGRDDATSADVTDPSSRRGRST